MRKIFISLVLTVGFVAVTSSCGETATKENAEEVKTEQAEAKATVLPTAVTTSKGTYDVKMVMKRMYKEGVSTGKAKKALYDKSPSKYSKEKLLEGAESNFKEQWNYYYGTPNNDEAKTVYEKALEKYLQGWEDGWGVNSTTIDSIK